jgi:hypothetical protein
MGMKALRKTALAEKTPTFQNKKQAYVRYVANSL